MCHRGILSWTVYSQTHHHANTTHISYSLQYLVLIFRNQKAIDFVQTISTPLSHILKEKIKDRNLVTGRMNDVVNNLRILSSRD